MWHAARTKVPCGRQETTTFLGALRTSGFVAPLTIDGPLNGPLFLAWVTQHLAPTLSPGDIVVMDNLSSHKVPGVRAAIEATGAARAADQLWQLCGRVLDAFSEEECRNYFRHCGYRYS